MATEPTDGQSVRKRFVSAREYPSVLWTRSSAADKTGAGVDQPMLLMLRKHWRQGIGFILPEGRSIRVLFQYLVGDHPESGIARR